MKAKTNKPAKKKKNVLDEYNFLFKTVEPIVPINFNQWSKNGDYIVKFSLYDEIPKSVATTDTNACAN